MNTPGAGKKAVDTANVLAAAAGVVAGAMVTGDAPAAMPVGTKVAQVDGHVAQVKPADAAQATAAPEVAKTTAAPAKAAKVAKAAKAKKADAKGAKPETKAKEKKVNTKLVAAKRIFDKMCAKAEKPTAGDVAGAIQKELKISYSNAYYYVTRVFGMKAAKAK